MRGAAFAILFLASAATAQNVVDNRVTATRIAAYQERLANVYLSAGYDEGEVINRMRNWFNQILPGVSQEFVVNTTRSGVVDYQLIVRESGEIVQIFTLATIEPKGK